MVYLKSVENVITLGKLIGLLFLFCLPLLSILFLKTKRNDLTRPVMGTIFLVMIMLCVICRLMYASCIYDRRPIVVHIYSTKHNRRDQKGLIMIKHPVTKNSAKEEPQNCINYC